MEQKNSHQKLQLEKLQEAVAPMQPVGQKKSVNLFLKIEKKWLFYEGIHKNFKNV